MDNEQEIIRALAEFEGYSEIKDIGGGILWGYNPNRPFKMDLPDYLHDLNSMHEVGAELFF